MRVTTCGVFIVLRAPWRCCRHPRPGPSWVLCAHISHRHPREPEAGGPGSWPGQDGGRVWRHLSHTSAWSARWDPSPQPQPLLESASQGLSSSRLPLGHQDLSQTGCACSQGWSLWTCVPLSEHLYEEWGPKWGAVTSAQALCWAVPGTVSWNLSPVPSSSSHLESCFWLPATLSIFEVNSYFCFISVRMWFSLSSDVKHVMLRVVLWSSALTELLYPSEIQIFQSHPYFFGICKHADNQHHFNTRVVFY